MNILQSFDDQIEHLRQLRAFFAEREEALTGWYSVDCDSRSICEQNLIQLFRDDYDDPQKMSVKVVDAKIIARAIGTDWRREGNNWRGKLTGFPKVRVILHAAVTGYPDSEVVEL